MNPLILNGFMPMSFVESLVGIGVMTVMKGGKVPFTS